MPFLIACPSSGFFNGLPGCSAFERYFNEPRNRTFVTMIAEATPNDVPRFSTLREYFTSVANFSATQFFSDDTIEIIDQLRNLPGYPPPFDPPLSGPPSLKRPGAYMINPTLPAGADRVARLTGLTCPTRFEVSCLPDWTLNDPRVLMDNAKNLYPQAILHSAGVLDFFFRARLRGRVLEIRPTDGDDSTMTVTVEIENISDLDGFAPWDMTLEDLTSLKFYQEDDDGMVRRDATLTGDDSTLAPGQSARFEVRVPRGFDLGGKLISETQLTAVYRGMIGQEEGVVGLRLEPPVKTLIVGGAPAGGRLKVDGFADLLAVSDQENMAERIEHARPFHGTSSETNECPCPAGNADPPVVVRTTTDVDVTLDVQPTGGRLDLSLSLERRREERRSPTPAEQAALDSNPLCCIRGRHEQGDVTILFVASLRPRQVLHVELNPSGAVVSATSSETGWRATVTFVPIYVLFEQTDPPTACYGSLPALETCTAGGQRTFEFSYEQLRARHRAAAEMLYQQFLAGNRSTETLLLPPSLPPVPPLPGFPGSAGINNLLPSDFIAAAEALANSGLVTTICTTIDSDSDEIDQTLGDDVEIVWIEIDMQVDAVIADGYDTANESVDATLEWSFRVTEDE